MFFVVIVHWHCSAQLSMFNMEKRYRNKIIIIMIIIKPSPVPCLNCLFSAAHPSLDSQVFTGKHIWLKDFEDAPQALV